MIWAIPQERISERIVAELMLLRLTVAQIIPQNSIQCSTVEQRIDYAAQKLAKEILGRIMDFHQVRISERIGKQIIDLLAQQVVKETLRGSWKFLGAHHASLNRWSLCLCRAS